MWHLLLERDCWRGICCLMRREECLVRVERERAVWHRIVYICILHLTFTTFVDDALPMPHAHERAISVKVVSVRSGPSPKRKSGAGCRVNVRVEPFHTACRHCASCDYQSICCA